ncbi:hypothetical protein FDUTEX481_05119 [Tolypothrix sp. PCC 7601]|nr:hypothetical protein FDUTEX481_05119 [Tolypothrix sp. PCC 7601]
MLPTLFELVKGALRSSDNTPYIRHLLGNFKTSLDPIHYLFG